MKKVLFLALMITAFTVFLSQPVAVHAGSVKVEVCHFPPGNPDNFHTIKVSEKAAQKHIDKHGDLLGGCEALGGTICDDNNGCTIDRFIDGTTTCADPEPVECEDSDGCTTDVCNPTTGVCEYPAVVCDPSGDLCAPSVCVGGEEGNPECGGTPVVCNAGEACDPATGECVSDGCQSDAQCQVELNSPEAFCSTLGDCRQGTQPSGQPCSVVDDCTGPYECIPTPDNANCTAQYLCYAYDNEPSPTCKINFPLPGRNFPLDRGTADPDGQNYYAPMLCPIGEADDAIAAKSDASLLGHWQVR